MSPSQLQMTTIAKLCDPVHKRLRDAPAFYAKTYPDQFWALKDYAFPVYLYPNGQIKVSEPLVLPDGQDSFLDVTIRNSNYTPDEDLLDHGEIAYRINIPIVTMLQTPGNYSIYCIAFDIDDEDTAFDQLRAGYIGITKRAPLSRLKEHVIKVNRGRGSIVHKAWRALIDSGIAFTPVFRVFDMRPKTLEQVYDREEMLVEKHTLSPKGLNAIPGGMAGIRMMHELRLLSDGTKQVHIEKRDAAIELLMEREKQSGIKATHFRSGHVRRLAGGKNTWVRACWVNLNDAKDAA